LKYFFKKIVHLIMYDLWHGLRLMYGLGF